MRTTNAQLTRYLQKHGDVHILEPRVPEKIYDGGVVIPCLAESTSLPLTLNSLADCASDNIMVLIVVNQSPDTDTEKTHDNQLTLQWLSAVEYQIDLFWIDAASPGKEIQRGGVGAARKMGMDTGLQYLKPDGLLFCLDADTLVEPEYLQRSFQFFHDNPMAVAGVCEFRHQPAATPVEQAAIIEYELYMRYYELGLKLAGSPYAYQALGSAIVVPAAAYVKAGGMRAKNGGEDFYFLQALRKFGPVSSLKDITVHPAARPSDRVPFGTGPKIRRIADGEHIAFHHPQVFIALKKIIEMVKQYSGSPEKIPEKLDESFFSENNFPSAWDKIIRNTPAELARVEAAFHIWFDAFRNLKYIHFIEQQLPQLYPSLTMKTAFRELFRAFDMIVSLPDSPEDILEFLRKK
jgi:glycosyltransferase involved in cell wall biosynthesis